MMRALFLLSVGLVFWTYVGYPLFLWAIDAIRRLVSDVRYAAEGIERRARGQRDVELPSLSVLIAARNERAVIGRTLERLLAADWPCERLEILVGSDASDDGTDEAVRAIADPRVTLVRFDTRSGKAAVLNHLAEKARGDIFVLTDANTEVDARAPRELAARFHDPRVGLACGRLVLRDPAGGASSEGLYWKYETVLKLLEGRLGVCMGANGGLYAIARELWQPLPDGTVVDDFVVALRALASGRSVVYAPEALAFEETAGSVDREFHRRARIGAGNFQSLRIAPALLNPRHGLASLALWSHKLVRWTVPLWLSIAFVANLFLLGGGLLYRAAFVAQLALYALAALGTRAPARLRGVASHARYFVVMNAALATGLFRHVSGRQRGTWEPIARPLGRSAA